jgi:DNA-directed RNA polymerase specialized sigma subunit
MINGGEVQFLAEKWLRTKDSDTLDRLAKELRPGLIQQASRLDRAHYEDMVQHALSKLVHILNRYDVNSNVKFHTFFWVTSTGYMRNYIRDYSKVVRVSRHTYDIVNKYSKFIANFIKDHGREPTVQESAKSLKVDEEELQKIVEILERLKHSYNFSCPESISVDIQTVNPEEALIDSIINNETVGKLVADVQAGRSLAYLFPGDRARSKKAEKLVKAYIQENL